MAKVYAIDDVVPVMDPSAFVHPDAVIIGGVIISPGCYVGPCVCLRGDLGRIRLEAGVNVQDTCVIHSSPAKDVLIEENGHVGHGAVLHGCRVGKNALIGMNSVIMDDAVIGENSFVAAMTFVGAAMEVEPNSLVAGIPAKKVRRLSEQEVQWKSQGTAGYQRLAVHSLASMKPVAPLEVEEASRKRIGWSKNDAMPLNETRIAYKGRP